MGHNQLFSEVRLQKSFDDICTELRITKHQLNSFIHFLREVDCDLEYFSENGIKSVRAPKDTPTMKVEFSLLEWLQFQANFLKLSQNKGKPYFDSLVEKFSSVERKYKNHDIYTPLEKFEQTNSFKILAADSKKSYDQAKLNFIEECILDKQPLRLVTKDVAFNVFARYVVFIDGHLGLIAESISDHCLIKSDLKDIKSIEKYDNDWCPKFTKFEVDEFVLGLRGISENEIRLILKIYSQEKFNLNLRYQLFGNPCMLTNPAGELIWAASIEPSEEIFDWLLNLGDSVEVLDPVSFKKLYLDYCESNLKKLG